MSIETPFGPTGETVYKRTYSRTKPNGEMEVWPETVRRVAEGNLSLVYGERDTWSTEVQDEFDRLCFYMDRFAIIPAGRHLWASGVKGRQYLFNCHVSGWTKNRLNKSAFPVLGMEGLEPQKLSTHFEFTFMRLMEGGGVGANYSSRYLEPFGAPRRALKVHIVCDPSHADYEAMREAGVLSTEFDSDWAGAFEVEDSREGWAAAMVDLLDTYMQDEPVKHEDRVYDVSRVRPKGARLKTFGGTASGPQPFGQMLQTIAGVMNAASSGTELDFGDKGCTVHHLTPTQAMEIDHAIAECVVSGGVRRSARMAIVRWDDLFIDAFLACKADSGKHWTTNISVEIDDEFFHALAGDLGEDLEWLAKRVHQAVVKGMLTNGEPGYWNSTYSNVGEVGRVIATNPCGEIALEEWENCNLGHINLDYFAPKDGKKAVDILGLDQAHRLMARFLIRATYGDVNDAGQAERLASNRRIGVGHLGVQGFLVKRGIRYSDGGRSRKFGRELRELRDVVRKAARDYAFELRIPEPVKVTTVAPTGSIAKLPGVTEGIHPVLFRYFEQRVRFNVTDEAQKLTVIEANEAGFLTEIDSYDQSGNTYIVVYPTKHKLVEEVEALGYEADLVETADEISLSDMLAFQATYQTNYADNAVSFTVNVPATAAQQADFELQVAAYGVFGAKMESPDALTIAKASETLLHWLPKLKGTTLMVDGSRPQAPYTKITEEQYLAAQTRTTGDGIDENCANGACPVR